MESVSLTGLKQSNSEFFNPNNDFDADGLTPLIEEIESRRKLRNDTEQDPETQPERLTVDCTYHLYYRTNSM